MLIALVRLIVAQAFAAAFLRQALLRNLEIASAEHLRETCRQVACMLALMCTGLPTYWHLYGMSSQTFLASGGVLLM